MASIRSNFPLIERRGDPEGSSRAPPQGRAQPLPRGDVYSRGAVLDAQPPGAAAAPDKGLTTMNKFIIALAAAGVVGGFAASASANHVSGALIGGSAGAVVAGPPGAVVGGVIGAVVGGPNFHNHHRVYRDGSRHYYWSHHERRYY
jgi:hypothetical protein